MIWILIGMAFSAEPLPRAERIDQLIEDSKGHGTTALYIEEHGEVLVDYHQGKRRPIRAMSVTKSVVAILILRLIEQRHIKSLEQPLSTWYPELDADRGRLPLKAMMAMTSGIEPCPDLSKCDDGGDAVAFALGSEQAGPAGVWAYDNNPVNLLSGVVETATGMPMDAYAAKALFEPLGIRADAWEWERDRTGTAYVSGGLSIEAHALAQVGRLVALGGEVDGKRLISSELLDEMTRPQAARPWFGLLWWPVYAGRFRQSDALLDYALARGVDPTIVRDLRPLTNTAWDTRRDVLFAQQNALGGGPVGIERRRAFAMLSWPFDGPTEIVGTAAEGYLGQYLVVLPELGVVAVRQRAVGAVYRERRNDPKELARWPDRVARAFSER